SVTAADRVLGSIPTGADCSPVRPIERERSARRVGWLERPDVMRLCRIMVPSRSPTICDNRTCALGLILGLSIPLLVALPPVAVAQPKLRTTLKPERSADVFAVAFSPDGKTLASMSRNWIITLWDVASGKDAAARLWEAPYVNSLAFSPDGKTLAT